MTTQEEDCLIWGGRCKLELSFITSEILVGQQSENVSFFATQCGLLGSIIGNPYELIKYAVLKPQSC